MDRPALSAVPAPVRRPASRYVEGMLRETRVLVAGSQHCLEESRALLEALPPRRLPPRPAR